MTPPRLLVISERFPGDDTSPWNIFNLEQSLQSFLGSYVSQVWLYGNTAYVLPPEKLLQWAVLGKGRAPHADQTIVGGCDLYVGITYDKNDPNRPSRYHNLAEDGFAEAGKNRIPAVLLNEYNVRDIRDFVIAQSK